MATEKRLIDANALMEKHCEDCTKEIQEICKTYPICSSMTWIFEAPTVDAVEVVHCKDCKHYFHYGDGIYGCRTYGMMKTEHDGFCSYGERKYNERKAD